MPEELPLDASWDTIYTAGTHPAPAVTTLTMSCRSIRAKHADLAGLPDVAGRADTVFRHDRAIATSIVDAVDDTGYLTVRWKIFSKVWAMKRSTSTRLSRP